MWCCFQYLVDPLFNSTDLLNKTFYPVLGFRRMHPTARYQGTLPPKWNHWHPPGRLVPLHSNHEISGLVCPNHIWGLDSIYKEHNSHSVLPANIIECIPYWLPSGVHTLVRSPPTVILGLAMWPPAKGPLAKVMHTEAGEVLVHFVLPFRGLSWHMGRSHGEELRCLGQQPQAIVRHVREAIQYKTATAYLLHNHKRSNESSQRHVGQSWVLPKWLTCRIGSKLMVLVSNHWKLLSSTLPFPVPVSQNRDMVSYVEEDKAWRKLAEQKQGVFYLTRTDRVVGDGHLTWGHCGQGMTGILIQPLNTWLICRPPERRSNRVGVAPDFFHCFYHLNQFSKQKWGLEWQSILFFF